VLVQLGYPVASVLAGLGIGGLGLALAAQKTVENLFGSVSLAVDETIRIGDLVQIDTVLGRVEAIGLRSTRIRTPDRTVVSIPNGALAAMRIESLTSRDRMRFVCSLGLEHGATAAQLRELMAGIEALLRAQPQLFPDGLTVSVRQLGPSSIDLDVLAWFSVSPDAFPALRSELLLGIKELVERAGASFAVPMQPAREPK
jgi:MscS family membrane protein